MAFKMKGMVFKEEEGPVKPISMIAVEIEAPEGDPTFEYGFEESEKMMELRRKGLIPDSQSFIKKGKNKK
jgi:hypothetical protein